MDANGSNGGGAPPPTPAPRGEAFEPITQQQLIDRADAIAAARSALYVAKLKGNPATAYCIFQRARGYKIFSSPAGKWEALDAFHIIEPRQDWKTGELRGGGLALDYKYQIAEWRAHGHLLAWISDNRDDKAARLGYCRREWFRECPPVEGAETCDVCGQSLRPNGSRPCRCRDVEFTVEDAAKAGLITDKSKTWNGHRAVMLRARAVTTLGAMEFAGEGWMRTPDEMEEIRGDADEQRPTLPAPRAAGKGAIAALAAKVESQLEPVPAPPPSRVEAVAPAPVPVVIVAPETTKLQPPPPAATRPPKMNAKQGPGTPELRERTTPRPAAPVVAPVVIGEQPDFSKPPSEQPNPDLPRSLTDRFIDAAEPLGMSKENISAAWTSCLDKDGKVIVELAERKVRLWEKAQQAAQPPPDAVAQAPLTLPAVRERFLATAREWSAKLEAAGLGTTQAARDLTWGEGPDGAPVGALGFLWGFCWAAGKDGTAPGLRNGKPDLEAGCAYLREHLAKRVEAAKRTLDLAATPPTAKAKKFLAAAVAAPPTKHELAATPNAAEVTPDDVPF